MNPILADLTELAPLAISGACVVVAILGLVGFAWILRGIRSLRHDIASELKQEFAAGREPTPVSLDQPFTVKPQVEYATKAELHAVDQRVHELADKIESNFRELDRKRSVSIAGLHDDLHKVETAVHQRIDAIPAATIALLTETKKLHGK